MSLLNIIENTVSRDVELSKTVVLYGAGNFAKECLKALKKHNYEVVYIIDKEKYKDNGEVESIPVISLHDVQLNDDIKTKCSCVLGIFNAYVDLADIEEDIKDAGFKDIINPLEFIEFFYDDMGDHFWLTTTERLKDHKNSLVKTYSKLTDQHSKDLFKNIIKYRLTKQLNVIVQPQNFHTQYIPEDIDIRYPTLNFIDCGAYDGDTIMHLIKNGMSIDSFVAFEPDLENITKLSHNIQSLENIKGFIYPCGVYSASVQLRFSGGEGSASHINENGDVIIQVVSMDEVLLAYEVNFMKMDIEGAEIEALIGAKELIQKNTPILAISAYHKFDDLWTILDLIDKWRLGYSFYLRVYEHNGFGLVYYGIPKKYQTT